MLLCFLHLFAIVPINPRQPCCSGWVELESVVRPFLTARGASLQEGSCSCASCSHAHPVLRPLLHSLSSASRHHGRCCTGQRTNAADYTGWTCHSDPGSAGQQCGHHRAGRQLLCCIRAFSSLACPHQPTQVSTGTWQYAVPAMALTAVVASADAHGPSLPSVFTILLTSQYQKRMMQPLSRPCYNQDPAMAPPHINPQSTTISAMQECHD